MEGFDELLEGPLHRSKVFLWTVIIASSTISLLFIAISVALYKEGVRLDYSSNGFNNLVKYYDSVWKLSAFYLAIIGLVALIHKSNESNQLYKRQLAQDVFSNYFKHKESFFEHLEHEFSMNDSIGIISKTEFYNLVYQANSLKFFSAEATGFDKVEDYIRKTASDYINKVLTVVYHVEYYCKEYSVQDSEGLENVIESEEVYKLMRICGESIAMNLSRMSLTLKFDGKPIDLHKYPSKEFVLFNGFMFFKSELTILNNLASYCFQPIEPLAISVKQEMLLALRGIDVENQYPMLYKIFVLEEVKWCSHFPLSEPLDDEPIERDEMVYEFLSYLFSNWQFRHINTNEHELSLLKSKFEIKAR